jgi:hypothetical protein
LAKKIIEELMTYKEIQEYVRKKYGFEPQSCWIAHAKELCGLPVKKAPNRKGEQREKPCPENKRSAIREALIHFGFLDSTAGR